VRKKLLIQVPLQAKPASQQVFHKSSLMAIDYYCCSFTLLLFVCQGNVQQQLPANMARASQQQWQQKKLTESFYIIFCLLAFPPSFDPNMFGCLAHNHRFFSSRIYVLDAAA